MHLKQYSYFSALLASFTLASVFSMASNKRPVIVNMYSKDSSMLLFKNYFNKIHLVDVACNDEILVRDSSIQFYRGESCDLLYVRYTGDQTNKTLPIIINGKKHDYLFTIVDAPAPSISISNKIGEGGNVRRFDSVFCVLPFQDTHNRDNIHFTVLSYSIEVSIKGGKVFSEDVYGNKFSEAFRENIKLLKPGSIIKLLSISIFDSKGDIITIPEQQFSFW